jgi:hypothetical protein
VGASGRLGFRLVALAAAAALATLLVTACNPPKSFAVDSTTDASDATPGDGTCATAANECTLRAAIEESGAEGANATITLEANVTYTLMIGSLSITTPTTIAGNGSTLDANHLGTALVVNSFAPPQTSLAIDRLTIINGTEGAIAVDRADSTLVVSRSTIRNNSTFDRMLCLRQVGTTGQPQCSGRLGAGGIASRGLITLVDSTVADNDNAAGSLSLFVCGQQPVFPNGPLFDACEYVGAGGITGVVHSIDSTISGNSSHVGAGAVLNPPALDRLKTLPTPPGVGGGVTLSHTTMVGNRGFTDVDSQGYGPSIHGVTTVTASALSGPGSLCQGLVFQPGDITSGGYNAASDSSCGLTQPTDTQGQPFTLGALTDNGGPTPTHLPGPGAPLVDAIPSGTAGICDSGTPTDQRGLPRPAGPGCDIGAVERQPTDP